MATVYRISASKFVDAVQDFSQAYMSKANTFQRVTENIQWYNEAKTFIDKLLSVANTKDMLETLNTFTVTYLKTDIVALLKQNEVASSDQVAEEDQTSSNCSETTDENDISYVGLKNKDVVKLLINIPFLAVVAGREDILQLCINTGFPLDVFKHGISRQSLLHVALAQTVPKRNIIRLIMDHISVNIDCCEDSCLHTVLKSSADGQEKEDLLSLLVNANANTGKLDKAGLIPLTLHINMIKENRGVANWKKIIDILTIRGDEINTKNIYGQTPLHRFVFEFPPPSDDFPPGLRDNIANEDMLFEVLEYLILKGSDLNSVDISGDSLVHAAIAAQNVRLLQYLIQKRCPVNLISKIGFTAIFEACARAEWQGDEVTNDLIPMLDGVILAGCNINTPSINGCTALHTCCAKQPVSVCNYLLNSGSNIDAKDFIHRTALHYTAYNHNLGVVDRILSNHYDLINVKDIYGYTALHYACMYNNVVAIQQLIANKADVSALAAFDVQPLHVLAEVGEENEITLLVTAGADVKCVDYWNATPLHYAGWDGYPECSEALISYGADKNAKDCMHETPLSLALSKGQYKMALTLADSKDIVQFGKLQSFPNRPAIAESELPQYCEQIRRELCTIGNCEEILKSIQKTTGLSCVTFEEKEDSYIREQVEMLVNDVVIRIGELDKRFEGMLIKSGSSYEGVKIGYPDEFDFMIDLVCFSNSIEKVIETNEGFLAVYMKKNNVDISEFVTQSGVLNPVNLYTTFRRLARRATWDVQPKYTRLQGGYDLITEFKSLFCDDQVPHAKLMKHSASFRGCKYKILDISIDLNPVIYTKVWPNSAIQSFHFIDDMSLRGVYLIPKHSSSAFGTTNEISFTADDWRISFSHIESEIFNKLPKHLMEAFCIIKAFKQEPFTPAIIQEERQLKHPKDYFEYKDNEADSSTEENANELDLHSFPIDLEKLIANEDAQSNESSGNSEASSEFDYEKFQKELYSNDSEIGRDDLTMDICIPTYSLKQLFFIEVDKMCKSGPEGLVLGDNMKQHKELLWKVYTALEEALEVEYLPSFFVKGHNLYKRQDDYLNEQQSNRVRKMFVSSIVELLRKTGFSD